MAARLCFFRFSDGTRVPTSSLVVERYVALYGEPRSATIVRTLHQFRADAVGTPILPGSEP